LAGFAARFCDIYNVGGEKIPWIDATSCGARFRLLTRPLRASTAGETAPQTKLVYHLNDLGKVSFALGNIQNHLDARHRLT